MRGLLFGGGVNFIDNSRSVDAFSSDYIECRKNEKQITERKNRICQQDEKDKNIIE
jgi:hypothetical protein